MAPMTRRAPRPLVTGALSLVLPIVAATAALAVGFTPIQPAGDPYSWNPGKALAVTTGHLVSAWASDCPPPTRACARETSPTIRVFVQRSAANRVPAVWGRPVRVSPLDVHAERVTLSADGALVAVGWVTQRSYLHYDPTARRVFWVRVSSDRGRHWRKAVRMTLPRGRVDYPRLAVSDGTIYAVWTNADTGDIRLAKTSDEGTTWAKVTLEQTSSRSDGPREGFAGLPDVGASGGNVAVIWYANQTGATHAVFSDDGGAGLMAGTVAATTLVGSSPNDGRRYAAAAGSPIDGDGRVAVAYTTTGAVVVRVWDGTGLGSSIPVA